MSTTDIKAPWPLRALALVVALLFLGAYVGLVSCARDVRTDAKPVQPHVAPPDLAPATVVVPAPGMRDPSFWPATKSAPMHLLDRPPPQQQAPQQQRNVR